MRRLAALLPIALAASATAGPPRRAPPAYVESIRATVDNHLEEVTACMDARKPPRGGSQVRLDVQAVILGDGTVLSLRKEARGKGKGGEPSVEKCMLDKVKAWRFPAPPDGQPVAVSFPIILEFVK
jgi:hypothetical protein